MKHLSETKEYKANGLLSQAKMIEESVFWKTKYENSEAEKVKILEEAVANQEQSRQIDSLTGLAKNLEIALDEERQRNQTLESILTDLGIDVTKICSNWKRTAIITLAVCIRP